MMLGDNIKKFRMMRKFTQEELAVKLSVTRQAISKWENNKAEPDIEMLHSVASALGINIEEILYETVNSVRIISISHEKVPDLRLIGKRYNSNEHFRSKWSEWYEEDWFSTLLKYNGHYKSDKTFIRAKRIVNGCLEYWIGMLFIPETEVPNGYEYIDIKSENYASFRLHGRVTDITTFETHNICLDKLRSCGMIRHEDSWCLERYSTIEYGGVDTNSYTTVDYEISILK